MSNSDFISPCRNIIDIAGDEPGEEVEASSKLAETECPICLEPCTNQGDHRLAATRCGHLFGKMCITKSLGTKPECPSCRKACKKREVITLYDCHIVAADVSVIEGLKAEMTKEIHKRQKVYIDDTSQFILIVCAHYFVSFRLKQREHSCQ
jgi:SUMO ligase MMS21 Smc5/6 complex component